MPSINWPEVSANTSASLKTVLISTYRSIIAVILRCFRRSQLSFRNEIARAWISTIFGNVPTVLYSPPTGHNEQRITGSGFEAYVLPKVPEVQLKNADAVVLFAHGGGMILGHPLQYASDYRRWSEYAASTFGKRVHFVATKYPLSIQSKWPAQRDAFIANYEWILDQGVQSSKVVFAGDSAGANLAILSLLRMRSLGLPMPACAVFMSPWLDMTGAQTLGSPFITSDFMTGYDAAAPLMNATLRPFNTSPDTPEISALLWKDISGLPPQLVMYASTEILGSDSERWIKRCTNAGTEVTEFRKAGEMHTFAMGWPICSKSVEHECDVAICGYILRYTQ